MYYVSRDIAHEILSDPEHNLQLGGRNFFVSVLFADIRGFTAFSERYPAAEVTTALNYIYNHLVPILFENRGTLDKYLGDAIMAFYGAPIPSADNVMQAIKTAQEMQRKFLEVTKDQTLLCGLGLGIGVCSGDAIVGNIGSTQFMDYTVIGNTPNTAKRLQEHAQAGQILVDEQTYLAIKDQVAVHGIAPLALKGLSGLTPAYEVEW